MVSMDETVRGRIEAAKNNVRDKYAVSKVAARRVAQAHAALIEAEEAKELKNNQKSITRCAVAENNLASAKKEFVSFVSLYTSLVSDVISLYEELAITESPKVARKVRAEAEKFEARENSLKDALYDIVRDVEGIFEMAFERKRNFEYEEDTQPEREERYMREEERYMRDEERREPQYQRPSYREYPPFDYYQPHYEPYRPYPHQPVNIAPTTIDISHIVEEAVASAMEKFKAVFSKRADEFAKENGWAEVSQSAPRASRAIVEMENEIAENEAEIAEKLKSIVENLKTVSQSMTELGVSYMALANAEGDAVEAQRKINDMQRALTREIQGVQANQKVIMGEQRAVAEEQAALIAEEKANVENQKLVCQEQSEAVEMQKALIAAQNALDASIKEIIASQKSIISNQQSIMTANAKNMELQRELSERQAELHMVQKSIMSEHKQLARKVKAKTEGKKPTGEMTDAAEKIIEETTNT